MQGKRWVRVWIDWMGLSDVETGKRDSGDGSLEEWERSDNYSMSTGWENEKIVSIEGILGAWESNIYGVGIRYTWNEEDT